MSKAAAAPAETLKQHKKSTEKNHRQQKKDNFVSRMNVAIIYIKHIMGE